MTAPHRLLPLLLLIPCGSSFAFKPDQEIVDACLERGKAEFYSAATEVSVRRARGMTTGSDGVRVILDVNLQGEGLPDKNRLICICDGQQQIRDVSTSPRFPKAP